MLSMKLSKDTNKRRKAENKVKKGKEMPKDGTAKWQGCVSSLLIYRRQEQDRRGRELGDHGMGSGRF